jgi:hypothetical protein
MRSEEIDWPLVYLLVLVEVSTGLVMLCIQTLLRKNPNGPQACRGALIVAMAAASAGGGRLRDSRGSTRDNLF